ncbi:hypothetical protein FE257_001827 [Aspergillus nanangensis]|uniref:SNF2 N-terminal domain-containing protein n=1 Tax=Aspergillus nanangensis TaxID=2582783 RepID=A0AAD4CDB0_ASPNN|nr:hypothetical protein FE257_001827 [Aspergillus nanangensis]
MESDTDSVSNTPLVSYEPTTTPGEEPKLKGKENLKVAFGLISKRKTGGGTAIFGTSRDADGPEEDEKPLESMFKEVALSEKDRICLQHQSPTFNRNDPFWLYTLAITALKNCERLEENLEQGSQQNSEQDAEELAMPTTVENTEEVIVGATSAIIKTPQMAESGRLWGAILADTVGLGKTWEAISFLMKKYSQAKEAKSSLPLG